jgi:L,D-transpeptidase catalytic domain/Putative peptidoglycan binding domain
MQGDLFHNQRPRRRRLRYIVPVLVALPFIAIAVGAALVASSSSSIRLDSHSLARVSLPFGGGTITQVVAIGGREQKVVPVRLVGHQILPVGKLPPGERITVEATIRRPGWNSWLAGKTERVKLTETTPVARLTSSFVTRKAGQPVTIGFDVPVTNAGHGAVGASARAAVLRTPQRQLRFSESSAAGTAYVAVAARSWELSTVTQITWFPAGARATAVATPKPGTKITPSTKITLTFSKPVGKVLGKNLPPVSPRTSGIWHHVNSHTIAFVPEGYGYGLGADVRVALPAGVNLVGGQVKGSDPVGQWTVPVGSTLALQQLLAQLGYLPVNFNPASGANDIASSPAAEETAIVNPPQGTFSWLYPNTPAQLKALWSPTNYTELTKGAVMAFEDAHGLPTDGVAGPDVWKALINAAVNNQKSTFGYTFVMVSEASPETEHVWHSGKIVVQGPVNTGIAAAPTALGTYAVYEHIPVGTMSGKNPDGSVYHDPGIPDISYFNGGDALHGFIRASYGFPQSLGCVEMPFSEAAAVYPYTPIGTIVNLTG